MSEEDRQYRYGPRYYEERDREKSKLDQEWLSREGKRTTLIETLGAGLRAVPGDSPSPTAGPELEATPERASEDPLDRGIRLLQALNSRNGLVQEIRNSGYVPEWRREGWSEQLSRIPLGSPDAADQLYALIAEVNEYREKYPFDYRYLDLSSAELRLMELGHIADQMTLLAASLPV